MTERHRQKSGAGTELIHYSVHWKDIGQFFETYCIITYGSSWRKDVVNNCLQFGSGKVKLKKRKIVLGWPNPSVPDSSLEELQQQHKFFGREMVNHYPTNHYPTNYYSTNHYPTNYYPTNHYPTNNYPTWMLFSPSTMERNTCPGEWEGEKREKRECCCFYIVLLFVYLLLFFWGGGGGSLFVCCCFQKRELIRAPKSSQEHNNKHSNRLRWFSQSVRVTKRFWLL